MSTLRVNTLQDATGSNQPAMVGAAKAWVNFDGTGTVAIRAAFNVSSITDNGTGDYTVNFTTAMVDADFAITITSGGVSGNTTTAGTLGNPINSSSASVVIGSSSSNTKVDRAFNYATIFR